MARIGGTDFSHGVSPRAPTTKAVQPLCGSPRLCPLADIHARLDRPGITFAEALYGFDEIPKPEELILLLKAWNDLPAAKKRAWQRAAERENRRVRSLS